MIATNKSWRISFDFPRFLDYNIAAVLLQPFRLPDSRVVPCVEADGQIGPVLEVVDVGFLPHIFNHYKVFALGYDLRRLHHEGWVLQAVLLSMPNLLVDRAEFAGLAHAGVAHVDAELHLEVVERLFGAVLSVQNVGNTHAAVAPTDIATQVQALMVTGDVARLALTAGPVRAGLGFGICEFVQKVLLRVVCLEIVVVHRVQVVLVPLVPTLRPMAVIALGRGQ